MQYRGRKKVHFTLFLTYIFCCRVPESCVLIIVGIIFGAILDEIDRCQPEVKDNNTVHRHTSKENYTVNSNKTKLWYRQVQFLYFMKDPERSAV